MHAGEVIEFVSLDHPRVAVIPDPGVDVAGAALASLEAARVRRLVAGLPPLERRVIRWRYGIDSEQLTCRGVAARLGCSLGNAHRLEQRALDVLRGSWTDQRDAA